MARPAKSTRTTESALAAPKSAQPRARGRRRLVAVGGVVGTAIVAALAAALITPGRIDDLFAGFTPDPGTAATPQDDVDYKRVVSRDGTFTFDIPEPWLTSSSQYNVPYAGTVDAGTAVSAGDDPTDGRQPTENGVYLAVSTAAATRLDLVSADASSIQSLLDTMANEIDWSRDGCVHGSSKLAGPEGWTTAIVPWDDCYSTDGLRLWEVFAVPPSRTYILCMQLQLSPTTDEAVLVRLIDSMVIDESRIPT